MDRKKKKKVIVNSRVKSTQLLRTVIASNEKKPKTFISASAVGYYGFTTSDYIYKEEDSPGNDFLADTCILWEKSIDELSQLGIPTAKIRIGLVLSKHGGALKEIAKPIQFGFGAPLGNGKQYMPWIHIDDLCSLFIFAMENKLEGAYNAGSPQQHTNAAFTKAVAKTLKKPLWLPNVPELVLKLILGSRALLVLNGSRVSPQKIKEKGFHFLYENLEDALNDIYR